MLNLNNMQEIFYEESTSITDEKKAIKLYKFLKYASRTFFALAFLWFAFFMFWDYRDFAKNILGALLSFFIPFTILITSGIILMKLKNIVHLTFDYTFINGNVNFSKVCMNIKRIRVSNFDTSSIVRIGKYDSEIFNKYLASPGVKVVKLTKNKEPAEGKGFYYIYATLNTGKKLFVLECSELFLRNIVIYAGRTVLEGF